MASQNRAVKHTAKAVWNCQRTVSIAIGLVLLFAYLTLYTFFQLTFMFLPAFVSVVLTSVLCFFWLSPLALGVLRAIWQQMLENKTEVLDVFYYFNNYNLYKKSLKFLLSLVFRLFGIYIVCFIPGILVDVISSDWIHTSFDLTMPLWISNLSFISSIFYFIGGTVGTIISIRFYISPFLFIINDDMEPLESIHLSSVVSKDNSWEFFILILSFILWFVLGNFIFPLIIIYPYFLTCYMVHCRFAIAQYNKKQDIWNELSQNSN